MKKCVLSLLLAISACHISIAQTITTIAGNGTAGYSGDGGAATGALLNNPVGLVFDRHGNIYFADQGNNRIRKISSSGIISTFAGNGTAGYSGDGGPATNAEFNSIWSIAIDTIGKVFISDRDNEVIRQIDTSGIVSTFAGNGSGGFSGDGGAATSASLQYPCGVGVDHFGNVYISDQTNCRIRKVDPSGIITTIAGTGSAGYGGDGGPASSASLYYPANVFPDNSGNIYISDQSNNRIRKIDASGTITTIAGNGTAGSSGDGGPATAAELSGVSACLEDGMGNIYVADENFRLRKISSAGIISTIAGIGTNGYTGDGGPATTAQVSHLWGIGIDPMSNIYFSDVDNNSIRKIAMVASHTSDSFKIFIDKYCSGPQIRVQPNHFTAGMYVKTYFGDGNTDSSAVLSSAGCIINHTYSNSGVYSIRQKLHLGSTIIDSFRFSFSHMLCNSFSTKFYYDANSNCMKDSSDNVIGHPITVEVDSNGVAIDTLSCTSGLYYTAYGSVGDIYGFKVIGTPAGLHVTCPSTGIIYDTISASIYSALTSNVALECSISTGFDLGIVSSAVRTGVHAHTGDIYAFNNLCPLTNATVTLRHSPKHAYYFATPTPASTTATSITWNISALTSAAAAPTHLYYHLEVSGSILTPGDTVNSNIDITPDTGDSDTSNNVVVIVDTVRAGYDPNEISVSPAGCIASGVSPTQLQYTIHFENTGNDTAHNIYVMDTLSNNVDISSMRLVLSSHEMYISKLKDAAGQNILKFDFPKINLRDSSHHGECDGAVIFNINTKPGLSNGTNIVNRAGIYFDVNPVVMTNTVTNTIGCPAINGVTAVTENSKIDIYPNPAYSELNIKVPEGAYQSYSITNSLGSVLSDGPLTKAITHLNIQLLPAGLYFLNLKGEEGNVVRKFVKW